MEALEALEPLETLKMAFEGKENVKYYDPPPGNFSAIDKIVPKNSVCQKDGAQNNLLRAWSCQILFGLIQAQKVVFAGLFFVQQELFYL